MSSIRDRLNKAKGVTESSADTSRKSKGSIRDRINSAREGNVEISPEMGAGPQNMGEYAGETLKDMGLAGLQGATLEWADNWIEMVDPESADKWREWVAKARERSPNATLLAEVLTPDLIDAATFGASMPYKAFKYFNKLGRKMDKSIPFAEKSRKIMDDIGAKANPFSDKLHNYRGAGSHAIEGGLKGSAKGAATDYVMQKGEGEGLSQDADFMQTAGSALLGGTVGTLAGAIKPRHGLRADTLGLNEDKAAMSSRTGGDILKVEEHTAETAKMLEDMNIFGGNTKFDAATHKFVGESGSNKRKSNLMFPPGDGEIYARMGKAKETIIKQINDLVAKKGDVQTFRNPDFEQYNLDIDAHQKAVKQARQIKNVDFRNQALAKLQKDMPDIQAKQHAINTNQTSMIEPDNPAIFSYHNFKEGIADIVNDSGLGGKNSAQAQEIIDDILAPLKEGELNLVDMQELRRAVDQATRWSVKTSDGNAPLKQEVYGKLGSMLRSQIKGRLSGTQFEELNEKYSRLMDVSETVGEKIGKSAPSKYIPASLGSYNPNVQTIQGLNLAKDKIESVGGQMSETLNTPRSKMGGQSFQNVIDRGTRKAVPVGTRDEEEINPNSSMMRPQERLDQMNMSKKLQQAKVPRNSEAIARNPTLLKYKIAQNADAIVARNMVRAGLDPESMPEVVTSEAENLYKNAEMLLTEMPDEIPAILPVWTKSMPELFEKDRYGRIDDVVPASLRQDAAKEIEKSGKYGTPKSTHEMIAELDELHSTGKYYG